MRVEPAQVLKSGSRVSLFWRRLTRVHALRQPTVLVAAAILLTATVCALVPSLISPYPQDAPKGIPLSSPSWSHLFGTDQLGRDVFSRTVHGARNSLLVGILAVSLGTSVGAVLGVVSGYLRGVVDFVVQRIVDSLLTLPGFLLALVIAASLGTSIFNIAIAIAIAITPISARVARGSTLSVSSMPYVEAARATGATQLRIIGRHIVPNVTAPLIVIASIQLGFAIIAEASLSFLGIGIPLGSPSWGNMLSGSSQLYLRQAPWMALAPGLALALVVMATNLLGDALRDSLDPRLRGRT